MNETRRVIYTRQTLSSREEYIILTMRACVERKRTRIYTRNKLSKFFFFILRSVSLTTRHVVICRDRLYFIATTPIGIFIITRKKSRPKREITVKSKTNLIVNLIRSNVPEGMFNKNFQFGASPKTIRFLKGEFLSVRFLIVFVFCIRLK